jgi:hypothetical protein
MAHGQWTEVEARAVLAAQKKSGLSIDAFARDNGLLPQRLYWWRKKSIRAGLRTDISARQPTGSLCDGREGWAPLWGQPGGRGHGSSRSEVP